MNGLIQMAASKLHEPLTWLAIATFVACCAAGWYCGDIARHIAKVQGRIKDGPA
jgi:hypothetical protein